MPIAPNIKRRRVNNTNRALPYIPAHVLQKHVLPRTTNARSLAAWTSVSKNMRSQAAPLLENHMFRTTLRKLRQAVKVARLLDAVGKFEQPQLPNTWEWKSTMGRRLPPNPTTEFVLKGRRFLMEVWYSRLLWYIHVKLHTPDWDHTPTHWDYLDHEIFSLAQSNIGRWIKQGGAHLTWNARGLSRLDPVTRSTFRKAAETFRSEMPVLLQHKLSRPNDRAATSIQAAWRGRLARRR